MSSQILDAQPFGTHVMQKVHPQYDPDRLLERVREASMWAQLVKQVNSVNKNWIYNPDLKEYYHRQKCSKKKWPSLCMPVLTMPQCNSSIG